MTEIPTTPTTSAARAVRALLADIVDYAGMFPPASLPLEDAIQRFAHYRRSPYAWMLARFVVPARRLAELAEFGHLSASDPPLRLSILPTGGDTAESFFEAFKHDLNEIDRFRETLQTRAIVEQIEVRPPDGALDTDVITVGRFLERIAETLEDHALGETDIFLEVPMTDVLHQRLSPATGAAAAFNKGRSDDTHGRTGIKMRTGGTEPEAFPSAEDVAFVIASCRNAGVPFKATAGLHHPLRRLDEGIGTKMHGFLNVFCAAVLAHAHELSEPEIASVLMDDDPSHFRFTADGLAWNRLAADVHTVERVRTNRALSFGSCSFTEPIDDLNDLGLL